MVSFLMDSNYSLNRPMNSFSLSNFDHTIAGLSAIMVIRRKP